MQQVFIKFFINSDDETYDSDKEAQMIEQELRDFLKTKNLKPTLVFFDRITSACGGFEENFIEVSSTYEFKQKEKLELVKLLAKFTHVGMQKDRDGRIVPFMEPKLKKVVFIKLDSVIKVV